MGIDPIRALVFAAIANGFVEVPLIWITGQLAPNRASTGDNVSAGWSRIAVGVTFLAMAASAVALLASLGTSVA